LLCVWSLTENETAAGTSFKRELWDDVSRAQCPPTTCQLGIISRKKVWNTRPSEGYFLPPVFILKLCVTLPFIQYTLN